ncbi:MAG: polyamine aminopropyltransferase [Geminicoccaceae bacterium]
MAEWYEEAYTPHWRQRFEVERYVYRGRTAYQEAIVFESPLLGRVLVLDGFVQTTERDEFIYHEMISHVAVMAHGAARDVLIIGGGDGGTLEEVLKHQSVARATMVELDPGVVELARRYLPGISRGAFDDPRTELVIDDGVRFVADADRQFDVIIVDSTDPVGPGEVLFTEAFYADCRARLRPGGILVAQSGNPFMERARLDACLARLGGVFRDTSFILTSVPAYLGGPFVFAWGCDDPGKRAPPAARLAAHPVPAGLRCYTPAVHAAAFVHPPWLTAPAE